MKKLSATLTTSIALALGVVGVAPANAIRLDFDKPTDETMSNYKEGYILRGDEWADWGIDISVDAKNGNASDEDLLTLYNTDINKKARGVGRVDGDKVFLKEAHLDNDLRTGAPWGTDPQGNVLIVQAVNKSGEEKVVDENGVERGKKAIDRSKITNDGRYKYVDDDARGAKITFDFLEADEDYTYTYDNLKIGLLDIDNSESSWVTVYYLDGEGQEQSQQLKLKMESEQLSYADAGVSLISNPETTILTGHNNNSLWEFNFDFLNQELDSLMSISKIDVEYKASGGVAYLEYDRVKKAIYGEEEKARVPEPSSALAMLALGAFGGGSILKRK